MRDRREVRAQLAAARSIGLEEQLARSEVGDLGAQRVEGNPAEVICSCSCSDQVPNLVLESWTFGDRLTLRNEYDLPIRP